MIIPEDIIIKVKEQNDIVDVISESVRLKRAGRNYLGLCPFHHEKTPSFSVSYDKQIFKCFGCGEAGNVISFVMKNKNVGFTDAVKILAERANIDINFEDEKSKAQNGSFERLYKINVEAARFYFKNLETSIEPLNYLKGRGITSNTIRKFGLGYSLSSWNSTLNYLRRKGYSELDLLDAGLIIKHEKGTFYDRFRNRVIFPVFDVRGKVIGFGGRIMDDSKPKYLNSPETAVFKKGTNLYGLNFAAKDNKSRTIIIVEGYMDCISLHQYGITNVAASLGTALTVNQAKLIKRFADMVIISYDADLAGQNATMRGLDILKKEGFDVRVLTVPQGKDPDEYIRNNGKEAFIKLIDEALPLIDYRIKRLREGVDFRDSSMVSGYIKNAASIISELNPIEKDIYIKSICVGTNIKEQAIYDLLSGEIQKNANKTPDMNILDNFGHKLYLEPAYIKAERSLLKLMLKNNETFNEVMDNIKKEDMILESHQKIYSLICENMSLEYDERIKIIEIRCDDIESSKEFISILDLEIVYDNDFFKQLIRDYVKEIKKYKLEESKKQVMNEIKSLESQGSIEESLKLTSKLVQLQKEIARL